MPSNSDAWKVLKKAKELEEELDVTGLISADRVFSLLERDLIPADIQSAVAKCLAPPTDVNRSAHKLLLRLARTPSGKIQIVTTAAPGLGGSQFFGAREPERNNWFPVGGVQGAVC